MKVEYVDYGIANNFGDCIEMNKGLKNYPDLHSAILQHELRHTKKLFSKQDLINDLKPSKIKGGRLLNFMITNPKSLIQFLPMYPTKKHGFVYDINLVLIYLFIIGIIGVSIFVGFVL